LTEAWERAIARRGRLPETLRAAVQPNPVLGVLLQFATAGAFIGTLVAYHRRRTDEEFEPFPIVTPWTVVGGLLGTLYVLGVSLP
jgi:hypothetical protein